MQPKKSFSRRLREIAVIFILVYLGSIALLASRQSSMMYFPPQTIAQSDLQQLKDFSIVTVTTEDQLTLSGYFVPPETSHKPILILFHGNASHPAWEAFKTNHLRNVGYGVLLPNYRGYAGNPGSPSETHFAKDADAFLAMIKKAYPDNPIILYGESVGSGVAVDLAVRTQTAAVILEVPFLSALDVAGRLYPFIPFLDKIMRDQYRNDLKVAQIKAPILFLLAGQDNVVSLASGEALFELANEPKTKIVFDQASHVNVYSYGAAEAVIKFLEGLFHD